MLHRDIVRMAKYLQISETNKNLVPSVPLFSKETEGTQYFEDHSILGRVRTHKQQNVNITNNVLAPFQALIQI